jgi:hypothetical protein
MQEPKRPFKVQWFKVQRPIAMNRIGAMPALNVELLNIEPHA